MELFNMNAYQRAAHDVSTHNIPDIIEDLLVACYDDCPSDVITRIMYRNYLALALSGEAGELAGEVKKVIREDHGAMTKERLDNIIAEMGDIMWYLSALATELGITLNDVAVTNIEKLKNRNQEMRNASAILRGM